MTMSATDGNGNENAAPAPEHSGENGPQGQESRSVSLGPIRLAQGRRNVVVNAPSGTTVRLHIGSRSTGPLAASRVQVQPQPQRRQPSNSLGDNRNVESAETNSENETNTGTDTGTGTGTDTRSSRRRPPAARRQHHVVHRRIPLPPANGAQQQIRIVTDGRSGTRVVPWHTTGASPNPNVRQLHPLPLPSVQQRQRVQTDDEAQRENSSGENHHRFKCPICFEFLREPVSCVSCNTHFCLPCINRVMRGTARTAQKCPTCRADMPLESLHPDPELQDEIRRADSVPCQYPGCDARLSLPEVAQHEEVCPFVMMKCRYSGFGCEWRGLRGDLSTHEAECPLMRVSVLVEQFRQSRARQEQAIAHLQQRVAASQGMMELQSGMIRRLHRRPMHVGDMLDLIYTVMCTPSQFLYTKDIWRMLHTSKEARGIVSNFCCLLPAGLMVAKNAGMGFRALLRFGDLVADGASSDEMLDVVVVALLSALSSTFGILLVLLFFFDSKSALEWTTYSRWGQLSRQLNRDLAAVTAASIVFVTMELDGHGWKASLVWMVAMLSTSCFPTIVLTILEETNNVQRESLVGVAFSGRARSVVMSGLTCGLALSAEGPMPCIDGILGMQVFDHFVLPGYSTIRADCLLDGMPMKWIAAYFAGRLSYILQKRSYWQIDGVLIFCLCSLLNIMSVWIGHKIGRHIMVAARAQLLPHQGGVSRPYCLLGISSFVVWMSLLTAIVISY